MGGMAIAMDTNYVLADVPGYAPVVPDTSGIDLPGQFLSMPGGESTNGSAIVSDGAGANAVYTDPKVNPNPTGGWMQLGQSVMNLAAQSMRTFSQGSPSPGVPQARRPLQASSIFSTTTATGGTNWLLIGGVVVVGVGALFAIAMWV